jgi:hypothetical protein
MVDTKSATVNYPGIRDWEIEIANLSRPELIKLRKSCMFTKMDRKTRQPVEDMDEDKFIEKFTAATIKGWKGLKVRDLEQLLLVDIGSQDPDTEVPYSQEDAELLVKNSGEFDAWLNDAVFDLENFRSDGEGRTVEETGKVAGKPGVKNDKGNVS